MALTLLGDIFVALCGGTGMFLLISLTVQHRRKWKQQDLLYMKVESAVYAWQNMNHGIGDEFTPLYNAKLEQLMRDRKFIDADLK